MKKELKTTRRAYLMVLMVVLVLSGCASQPKNQIMLMPAPDVFDRGDWDPFTDRDPIKDIPYGGILYATAANRLRKRDNIIWTIAAMCCVLGWHGLPQARRA